MVTGVRLLSPADAEELAALLAANRSFLAPWEPIREASYATAAGQRRDVEGLLRRYEQGEAVPLGILDGGGRLIGRATLTGVVHGAFRSADLGYWVCEDSNGRGHGTQAVASAVRMAFEELGLHRVQAGTLVHNERSQRVLLNNGFTRIGVAPEYLRIAGRWQDHVLFQRICRE